jgi:nucleoid-associated protein YgaU
MTRETKIGLLVGLAFIIVVGILLSDHFRGTIESAPAMLDRAGAAVRQTVIAPGSNQSSPPITMAPEQVNPRGAVQTPRDLEPTPPPVTLAQNPAPQPTLPARDPLAVAARQQGEELVSVPSAGAVAERSYRASPGDTVSRMAAKLLGANTYRNRQAIIQANASLQDDPDKVIVGQSYIIPGSSNATAELPSVAAVTAASGDWTYTVKSGDTLWGIATGQLNNAGAVESIKELNSDLLHGGSTLRPGMKLRLPSAPVAVAD